MANESEVRQVLSTLSSYYGRGLKSSQLQVYVRTLTDIESAILESTALDWITASSFYPRVSELRHMAALILEKDRQTTRYGVDDVDGHRTLYCGGGWGSSTLHCAEISAERIWKPTRFGPGAGAKSNRVVTLQCMILTTMQDV
jgi:hypothetical protein